MAARDLARNGAHVALVDGSHPREKPCGGGVTGRALELAGTDIADGCATAAVTFPAAGRPRRRYAWPIPSLDSRDVDAEQPAGDGWTIQAGARTLHAPWLLGADGAGGLVRKQVFRAFERRQLSIAAGSYVDGVDTTEIVIAFVDNPRGYLWSFPRPGHLAAGTCAQADETSTAEMHLVTDRWLDGYAPAAGRPPRRYAWPIPSLDARDLDAEQPAGDGWMLLGDAAGLVDPITREGIFFALRSGVLAAAALGSASPAHAYGQGVRDELHDELRRAARFKAGFFRPRFTGLLVDALNQSTGIRDVMIDLVAGRQPYRGLKRRLLGTLELGLMVRAFT